uniref:Ribose-phosphate pyrophosphokinase N-terminal domain-containing protein n=2 Tax=Oryza TaxID=4527 RepID=A0A0E0P5L1_ORYRU
MAGRRFLSILPPGHALLGARIPPVAPVSNRSFLSPVMLRIIRDANIKNDTVLRIVLGTANPSLSQDIAITRKLRGYDVFLVQPTCPVNENLMDLLIMTDACMRASANSITAVSLTFVMPELTGR